MLQEAQHLTLEDIRDLVSRNRDPAETLGNIVRALQGLLRVDVCSIYLLEPDRANLVLAATVGLRPASVGRVRMALHEGLAGMVAEHLRPIMVADAFKHPRFKYFPEAGEDPYHSFLGVPVIDRGLMEGVLVVQTGEARAFSEEEMAVLSAAAQQLGSVIGQARMVEQFIAPARERLWTLARNLWWTWNEGAGALFRDLDPVRWRQLDHNPITLLGEIPIDKLEERAGQLVLHGRINDAYRRLREYLQPARSWGRTHAGVLRARPVAYFSAEFGLHESLPIYSGGLGVLAGDHVKSASDLDVPLVGVGLFYDQGYFRQRLDADGWQHEEYLDVDVSQLPLTPALGRDGQPVVVCLETRRGRLAARVWRAAVGRCTLLLLDSDVDGNSREDRELTARLYGGDARVRIRQELLLGVGGVRALHALGIAPGVLHLNEGHSAFASLELIHQRMRAEGVGFPEAARRVAAQTVFTTHTPVPAGHDCFSAGLVEEHLGPLRDALGISLDHLMALGRVNPGNPGEDFCMTVVALKHSRRANAVSALHGDVSRGMWAGLWPGRPVEAVPVGHITNGVHVPTWLAPQMRQLYDRHLGPEWRWHSGEPRAWEGIDRIDDGELWETHQVLKARMINFVRHRAARQAEHRGEPRAAVEEARKALSMDSLTIGFARRFATYKRANLILHDLEELATLVNDPQKPLQIVFAGKAHPLDRPGKHVLQEIARLARDRRFVGKVVFLEDYDLNVARHLVQGVDVWLNTPRRPLEASGTSGQKVVLNGGLNLSVLDGWWAEAYDGANGFAVGMGETHTSTETHDRRDALALAAVLREEVVPLYYQRDRDGLPRAWIARMKHAIRTLGWRFNADRMVMDYVLKCYLPAAGGTSSDMSRQ
jgi:starch phosphorylase